MIKLLIQKSLGKSSKKRFSHTTFMFPVFHHGFEFFSDFDIYAFTASMTFKFKTVGKKVDCVYHRPKLNLKRTTLLQFSHWLYLCAPTWKECAIFTRAGPLFLDFGVVKFRKWASPSPFLFLSQLIMGVCIMLSTPNLKDLFPGKLIPNLMLYRFLLCQEL